MFSHLRILVATSLLAFALADETEKKPGHDAWEDISTGINNAIKMMVAKPDGTLNLAPEMITRMRGVCTTLDEYKLAERSDYWQCAENSGNNFVGAGQAYYPSAGVVNDAATFGGISSEHMENIEILSGLDEPRDGSAGAWCGMPAPPNDLSGDRHVAEYWTKCVMPQAGYFNTLQCDANGTAYAVLGLAALSPSVCYPAHLHFANEVYWQIGGAGTWRAWDNCSRYHDLDHSVEEGYTINYNFTSATCSPEGPNREEDKASTENVENDASKWWDESTGAWNSELKPHFHQPMLPHEMDSTTGPEHMLMIYFWGLHNDDPDNHYHATVGNWNHEEWNEHTGHVVPEGGQVHESQPLNLEDSGSVVHADPIEHAEVAPTSGSCLKPEYLTQEFRDDEYACPWAVRPPCPPGCRARKLLFSSTPSTCPSWCK